jgi:hypothetical protein
MIIPATLERLIHKGKAEAKVFSTGIFYQSILPIPKNQWAVIYGYFYKPFTPEYAETDTGLIVNFANSMQWVTIASRNKLYPFFHFYPQNITAPHTATYEGAAVNGLAKRHLYQVPTEYRPCYIPVSDDVSLSITINTPGEAGYTWGSGTIPENSDYYPKYFSQAGNIINTELSGYNWGETNDYNPPLGASSVVKENLPNVSTGLPPDQRNYTANGAESYLGLSRLPYITLYYVLMNFQPPQTIK